MEWTDHITMKVLYMGKYYAIDELINIDDLNEDEIREKLKRFYFMELKKVIAKRIVLYKDQLKVKPKSYTIIESRRKWGSCDSNKNLTFNYRLAMAPIEVIDYVVIHELCHMLHMNHDRSFWRKVGSVMKDYKEKEQFLQQYGHYMQC